MVALKMTHFSANRPNTTHFVRDYFMVKYRVGRAVDILKLAEPSNFNVMQHAGLTLVTTAKFQVIFNFGPLIWKLVILT